MKKMMIRTPRGATLGERVVSKGKTTLHYKAGKREDDLTIEELVECVSGRKVKEIIYD